MDYELLSKSAWGVGLGLFSGSGTTVFRGSVCCFFLKAVRGFNGPLFGSRSEYLVGLLPYIVLI